MEHIKTAESNNAQLSRLVGITTYGAIGRLLEAATFGHPLNVVRIYSNAFPEQRNVIKSIYRQGVVRGFYSGFSWNIVPISFGTGFRLVITHASDGITSAIIPDENKTFRAASIGIISPAISTLLFCPFGRMKALAITSPTKKTFRHHIAEKGLLDLWTGARMAYVRTATISVMFNTTYVNIAHALSKRTINTSSSGVNDNKITAHLAMSAAVAAIPHALVTTPIDMVKDQMQKAGGLKEHRVIYATKEVYKKHGLYGMLRTAPLKVIRSSWYFAFTTAFMYKAGVLPRFMLPPSDTQNQTIDENQGSTTSPSK